MTKIIISLIILIGCIVSIAIGDNTAPEKLLRQYNDEIRITTIRLADTNFCESLFDSPQVNVTDEEYQGITITNFTTDPKTKVFSEPLSAANSLRCDGQKLIDKLILTNSYTPYSELMPENQTDPPRFFNYRGDDAYPMKSVLLHIGLKAVSPIIKVATGQVISPGKYTRSYAYSRSLSCLIEIYAQAEHGREMAKRRVSLEGNYAASDVEKDALKSVLANVTNVWFEKQEYKRVLLVHQDDMSMITSALTTSGIWKDAYYNKDKAKTETLLTYLKLAYTLRCDGIESILVNHLMYSPFEGQDLKKDMALETKYPVYDTLCQIGITSVIPLIDLLKSPSTSDDARNLIIQALVNIYEQGGFGKEMTKYRLQLESGSSIGKDKELLDKALQNSILK